MQRYKTATKLGKVFVWLSLILAIAYAVIYAWNVRQALAMDPKSYNCTSDSMMKQICSDPFGSSISWGLVYFGMICWPFVIAWLIIGLILLSRRKTTKN